MFKKVFALVICLIFVNFFLACNKFEKKCGVQLKNPYLKMNSLAEAEKELGLSLKKLTFLPKEYQLENIFIIKESNLLEINYLNKNKDKICFRQAKGLADISGDYLHYENEEFMIINSQRFLFKGHGRQISLVFWQNKGISYSLSCPPLDKKEIKQIVSNIK